MSSKGIICKVVIGEFELIAKHTQKKTKQHRHKKFKNLFIFYFFIFFIKTEYVL